MLTTMKYQPILRRAIQSSHCATQQFVSASTSTRNYSNGAMTCHAQVSLPVFAGRRKSFLSCQPGFPPHFGLLTFARCESSTTNVPTAPVPEVRVEDGVLGALDGAFGAPHVHSTLGEEVRAAADLGSGVLGPKLTFRDIPEPPEIEPVTTTVESINKLVLNAAGEPTFESLGLGGWTPSGFVQQCMEFLHISAGLPWWGAILAGTIVVRILVFPLVIKSQRNAAKMRNHMPEMQAIQLKLSQAKQSGDQLMTAKYGHDLMIFMKEKDINPLKSMLVPLAMAPVFISFFFGLRKMANLPVESMRDGGLFWFTDLTVQDPYYILPLITSTTLLITLEIGADGVRVDSGPHSQLIKYFIRGVPLIIFPLTMHFPAALLCYWVSTNAISLVQVSFLKIPAIREKFGIEAVKKYNAEDLPMKKKGFMDSARDSWNNVKITKQLEERERFDEMSFKRAGRGPIPKTFKYDPTKVQAKTK